MSISPGNSALAAAVAAANAASNAAAAAARGRGRVLDINPLTYLEKIQGFDGRKEDLSVFCTNVDDILPTLSDYNEQAQKMCINIVKSKLTGKARRAMEIHPHLNNWTDIRKMLETNFGGFQTSDQLYEDLRAAQYQGNTLDYYNFVLHKLAMLNQKEGNLRDIERNIQTALKIFVTRLPVHMRTILCALKPQTLEEAIHELSQSGFLAEEKRKTSKNQQHQQQKGQNWQPKTNPNQQTNRNWTPKMYNPPQQQHHHVQQPKAEPMDTTTAQTRRQNHHQTPITECSCKCTNYVKQNKDRTVETYESENFRVPASLGDNPNNLDFPIFYSEDGQEILDY